MLENKVAVIGCGIVGLTNAVILAQSGYDVTIFSDKDLYETTTIAAVAIWMPYKVSQEQTLKWAIPSLEYYANLAKIPDSGVIFRTHIEFSTEVIAKPYWMRALAEGDKFEGGITAFSNIKSSHSVKLPIIDTYKLVHYLSLELQSLKVKIIHKKINDIPQDLPEYNLIVNATGVGARDLVRDLSVFPIKGQSFLVPQPEVPITQSIVYDDGQYVTVITPHKEHVTIGVSIHEHDNSLTYDLGEELRIWDYAKLFYPRLVKEPILARRVGLRPARLDGIRVETEYLASTGQCVIHSYGHASGGITLAPGCAYEVLKLVEATNSRM